MPNQSNAAAQDAPKGPELDANGKPVLSPSSRLNLRLMKGTNRLAIAIFFGAILIKLIEVFFFRD